MKLFDNVAKLGLKALHFCNTNASGILTIGAVIGVVASVITSAEMEKKKEEAIKVATKEKGEPLTKKEEFKETWYYYIPTIITSSITIGCILSAHGIDKKKQLEMIAAYNILKEGSDRFKKYAIEEIGKNKVEKIEHKVHEEDLKKHPVSNDILEKLTCDASTGGVVLKDVYTGQEFVTTYERIFKAAHRVNDKLHPFGNGGEDWWSWANFIEDCGGDYSQGCEHLGWRAIPFGNAIEYPERVCDPHVEEYKGHTCTVVYLNIIPDEKYALERASF